MKRKSAVLIALALILVPLLGILGGISVSAARIYEDQRSYDIYRTDAAKMVLDGKVTENEPWDKVPWSEQFRSYSFNASADLTGFVETSNPGHLKALWSNDAAGSYLFILFELEDPDGEYTSCNGKDTWEADVFQFFADETGTKTAAGDVKGGEPGVCHRTGSKFLKVQESTVKVGDWFEYFVVREGTTVTVEAKYTFYDQQYAKAGGVIGMEVLTQTCNGKSFVRQYAWSDNPQSEPANAGRGILKGANAADLGAVVDENADTVFYSGGIAVAALNKNADGKVTLPARISGSAVCAWRNRADSKLYAAGTEFTVPAGETVRFDAVTPKAQLRSGASVRLSGTAAMKFEGTVADFAAYSGLLSGSGIVIVETDLLTEALLEEGITPAALTAAGIAFVKAESATAERFEAVLEDIQDVEKSYSAIPYVLARMSDGTTVEFAGDYSAEHNSRSVKAVADAAYADRVRIKSETYSFKIGQEYGIEGFERISYSLYTREQLAFLKELAAGRKTGI